MYPTLIEIASGEVMRRSAQVKMKRGASFFSFYIPLNYVKSQFLNMILYYFHNKRKQVNKIN